MYLNFSPEANLVYLYIVSDGLDKCYSVTLSTETGVGNKSTKQIIVHVMELLPTSTLSIKPTVNERGNG